MLYTDTLFLLLFAILWLLCRWLRTWPVVKEWLLIVFSFLLIATWGYFDLALLLTVLMLNFAGAYAMTREGGTRSREILVACIFLDVAILAFFKYANFTTQNLTILTGIKIPDFPLGIPLAISFYIFHLISYLIDLESGRVKLVSFRAYLFYLSFFPHVVAGPIVRAWQLVPQIGRTRRSRLDLMMGVHFLITGFFLKSVIANNIGSAIDPLWTRQAEQSLTFADHWMVAFLYYGQIYGDFAGYSLMALGMARLLGYRLPANFRSPLRALSIQEFWLRWHITLSRWLRDYLYIPLGGNRTSALLSTRNVMITMLLGGLWHGAGWSFLLWGAMHGAGIVTERALGLNRANKMLTTRLVYGFIAQLWITASWVLFRSPSIPLAMNFLFKMGPTQADYHWHPEIGFYFIFMIPILLHNFFPLLLKVCPRRYLGLILGATSGLMLLLNITVNSPRTGFIYFHF